MADEKLILSGDLQPGDHHLLLDPFRGGISFRQPDPNEPVFDEGRSAWLSVPPGSPIGIRRDHVRMKSLWGHVMPRRVSRVDHFSGTARRITSHIHSCWLSRTAFFARYFPCCYSVASPKCSQHLDLMWRWCFSATHAAMPEMNLHSMQLFLASYEYYDMPCVAGHHVVHHMSHIMSCFSIGRMP